MKSLPSDIDELLAFTQGEFGNDLDGQAACRFLKRYQPSLLLLADARGELMFAESFESAPDLQAIRALATQLGRELSARTTYRWETAFATGSQTVFAARFEKSADAGFAACTFRLPGACDPSQCDWETSLAVCAAFGWAAQHYQMRVGELRTRVAHLEAEHETLKNSQAQAVAAAIEEREKRLQQQRQDMAQLEAVMKLAADGIITVNEDGIIESFNEAAGRIFGYDPNEVIGRDVAALSPSSNGSSDHEYLVDYWISSKSPVVHRPREVMGSRKDGTLFPLEIAVSEVPLDSGRVLTGIFRDIGDRRRLQNQLVQAQKMQSVGQLAAGIAHEINTPTQYVGDNTRFLDDAFRDLIPLLVNCRQLCQAIAEGTRAEDSVVRIAETARTADLEYLINEIPKAIGQSLEGVDRVAKIVRSMKDFSHPGGETKHAVDLNRALESTLTVCRNEWKYVAEAITEFAPELPLVTCLAGECNQVFLNLIINAAHAIGDTLTGRDDEKGAITIVTRHDGDWVEVRINDTGTGIPEEFHARIFDPFFTTKQVGRGTGQGLAIAHSVITEKHGGTIHFETEIGRGTTFVIRLPVFGESSSRKGVARD